MKELGKKALHWFFGRDLMGSRLGAVWCVAFLSLLWFITDWCLFSTFRAMSDWVTWTNLLVMTFLLTLPYLLTRRLWVFFLFLLLADILAMANIMYGRTYFTAIPPESYLLASNLDGFGASVTGSLAWSDTVFLLILVGGWLWCSQRPRKAVRKGFLRTGSLALLALLASWGYVAAKGGFYALYDYKKNSAYHSSSLVPEFHIPGHLAYAWMDEARSRRIAADGSIERWNEAHRRLFPMPDSLPGGEKPKRNLVIVLCESLESWPVGAYVEGKPIAPYLDSLSRAEGNFYAPAMLTQVGDGRSIDAQLLLTTGLLPMQGSVYSMKFPDRLYPSLPEAMRRDRGARSVIMTSDKPFTWNQQVIARSFGYDSLLSRKDWVFDETIGFNGHLTDGSFFRQAVEKLKGGDIWKPGQPVMLTLVTYSGHFPFRIPEEFRDPAFDISGAGFPELLDNYIRLAHYTDSQLRTLVEYLQSRPDWEQTTVVITGDHEGLSQYRAGLRGSSPLATSLVDEGPYTPLLILNAPVESLSRLPGAVKVGSGADAGGGFAVHYPMTLGQVDVYPTLLNMLGLENYHWHGAGQSLLSPGLVAGAYSSMTGGQAGDPAAGGPEREGNLREARRISDAIIRSDWFRHQESGRKLDKAEKFAK